MSSDTHQQIATTANGARNAMNKIFEQDLSEIPEEVKVPTRQVKRPRIDLSLTHSELAKVRALADPIRPATFAKLVLMAHVQGTTLELPKKPPTYPKVNRESVEKLSKYLNSVSHNINQLTRYCHTQQGIHQNELDKLIQLVGMLDVAIHKALLDPKTET